jgi:hypothetical protein
LPKAASKPGSNGCHSVSLLTAGLATTRRKRRSILGSVAAKGNAAATFSSVTVPLQTIPNANAAKVRTRVRRACGNRPSPCRVQSCHNRHRVDTEHLRSSLLVGFHPAVSHRTSVSSRWPRKLSAREGYGGEGE